MKKETKQKIKKGLLFLAGAYIVVTLIFFGLLIYDNYSRPNITDQGLHYLEKPVIYFYPEETTKINVNLEIVDGELTCTYPKYNDGWHIQAQPNGKVTNLVDSKEYSYLYWEGEGNDNWDLSKGFVVKGEDTAEFLQEKLSFLGLTPVEYNEFIVYWLPLMEPNAYNLIYFAGKDYTEKAKLTIDPAPDSIQRVFMVYEALEQPVEVEEQVLEPFTREGYTVIEWGGTEVKSRVLK